MTELCWMTPGCRPAAPAPDCRRSRADSGPRPERLRPWTPGWPRGAPTPPWPAPLAHASARPFLARSGPTPLIRRRPAGPACSRPPHGHRLRASPRQTSSSARSADPPAGTARTRAPTRSPRRPCPAGFPAATANGAQYRPPSRPALSPGRRTRTGAGRSCSES